MSKQMEHTTIYKYGQEIYTNAVAKGFYEPCETLPKQNFDPMWIACRLMLITSELSEALEAVRDENFSAVPKSGGFAEELADACIRIFDLAYSLDIDLEQAIKDKHNFNLTRPAKHGRKAL
jgi:NTP pyrophosphatase (non-canonical NTP hydrolase)